jgi:hypothetical protein
MNEPRKTTTTLSGFVEWVLEVGEQFGDESQKTYEAPWFRGVGDSRYHLVPTLYRTGEGRAKFSDDELRLEFARKALPLVAERAPRDDWEWYFLMQHYRAPTRLLDWTDSALVALYFALTAWATASAGNKDDQCKPAVWALNPWTLNRASGLLYGPVNTDPRYLSSPYSKSEIPENPIAIDPTFAAQRMLVQHSHFTLHGRDYRSIDERKSELGLDKGLTRIEIDADADGLEYLQWHLALLGVTETMIFPDLEGLARELRWEYGLDKRS